MSNQLSAGEKVVVTVFVAVRAAATGALDFSGNAVLGIQRDLGHLGTDLRSSGRKSRGGSTPWRRGSTGSRDVSGGSKP